LSSKHSSTLLSAFLGTPLFLSLCFAVPVITPAAPTGPSEPISTEERTYSSTIRTVQLFKAGFELAAPVIQMGSGEALVLRFDDLQANTENLSYTLVHCDAYWRPSDLLPGQYLSGAMSDLVPVGRQSYNTLQPFIHYEITFPNTMMRMERSGNYVVKVFRDGDENDVVLVRRFLVHEQLADIEAQVLASRQVDQRDVAQQLDLKVVTSRLNVQDPFGEIHVTVLQNMRWDDARSGLRPRYVRGSELLYDMPEQALFMGGNEYRNFDLKDLRQPTQRVARVEPGLGAGPYHAWLFPESRRTIRNYNNQADLNGRYLVRNDMVDGDPLGADYVHVHFTLPMETPLMDEVYIYGGLSDFQCQEAFRMSWSAEAQGYTAEVLLKQGFTDFSFVTLARNATVPDITAIEGSHYQTENDYLVLVYFTDHQRRCDRLVGMRFLNSRRS
jgi:hypothetical protein